MSVFFEQQADRCCCRLVLIASAVSLQDPGKERVISLSPRHAGAVVPVGPIEGEVAESDVLPKVIQAQH